LISAFTLDCNTSLFVLSLSNILTIILVIITANTNFMATSFSFIAGLKTKSPVSY